MCKHRKDTYQGLSPILSVEKLSRMRTDTVLPVLIKWRDIDRFPLTVYTLKGKTEYKGTEISG